jgi:hypothetical protein
LEFLRAEVPRLRGIVRQSTSKALGSTRSGHDSSASSDNSEDEEVTELPVTLNAQKPSGPRMSVSAEVFGKFNIE